MKKCFGILLLLLATFTGHAQQQPLFSDYVLNSYYYNPAVAGSKNVHAANVVYRDQWTGFEGAPKTLMANFYGSYKNEGKIGYGASVISDKVGLTQNTGLYVNYAHHFQLSKTIKLGLGVQPGYLQYRVRLYDIRTADEDDEVYQGSAFLADGLDLNAGFNLYSDKFFVMGSILHALGDEITFASYNSNLEKHYVLMGGYNFKLEKQKMEIQPSVLLKYNSPVPLQWTAGLRGMYNSRYWLGFGYRSDDALGVSLGVNLREKITIGYAFDYSLFGLNTYQSGSHQVTLSFILSSKGPSLEDRDEELNKSIMDEMKKNLEENKQGKTK